MKTILFAPLQDRLDKIAVPVIYEAVELCRVELKTMLFGGLQDVLDEIVVLDIYKNGNTT